MHTPTLSIWRCDDGTYDICGEGEVVHGNVPAESILAAHAHDALVARVAELENMVNRLLDQRLSLVEALTLFAKGDYSAEAVRIAKAALAKVRK